MNEMSTISAWVTDRFSRAELFEKLGIDFCCGGNKTLKEACEEKTFERFIQEIESHMKEEEELGFPSIRCRNPNSHQFFGKLEEEHQVAGAFLVFIRRVTNNFTLPPQACMMLGTTWAELEEIEHDMHKHVYKENYLLFPLIARQN